MTPEEMGALADMVASKIGGPSGGHPDESADRALFEPALEEIKTAITFLFEKIQCVDEKTDKLEKFIVEDLCGGIVNTNREMKREGWLGEFKNNFPQFGRFSDVVRDISGKDIYGEVAGVLYGEDGAPEGDDLKSKVDELIGLLESRYGKYLPKEPEKVEIEVETEVPPEAPAAPEEDDLVKIARRDKMAELRRKG